MNALPRIRVSLGSELLHDVELDQELAIGRSDECGIQLDDRAVSRKHLSLVREGDVIRFVPRSRFAPIRINGIETSEARELQLAEVIELGPYRVQVEWNRKKPDASRQDAVPVARVSTDQAPSEPFEVIETLGDAPAENEAQDGFSAAPVSEPDAFAASPEAQGFGDENEATRVGGQAELIGELELPMGVANIERYQIEKPSILIGRGAQCDVILTDRKSSRKHTLIERKGNRFVLKDLGSSNGTYVNGTRVQEAALSDRDLVRIGDAEFLFRAYNGAYDRDQSQFATVEELDAQAEAQASAQQVPMAPPELSVQQGPAAMDFGVVALPGSVAPIGDAAITGLGGDAGGAGNKSILAKLRKLPPRQQVMIGVIAAIAMWWVLEDEEPAVKKPDPASKPVAGAVQKGVRTFEMLSRDEKKFVQTQHAYAFELYKNREYDKAIFEVNKIFSLVGDYKDSKDIVRYAQEGKKKLEAMEAERKKKEAEEDLKKRVLALVAEAQGLMSRKLFPQASALFPQILALDPENPSIPRWQHEIDETDAEAKRLEEQRRAIEELNQLARQKLSEAQAVFDSKNYLRAIKRFQRVLALDIPDPEIAILARRGIEASRNAIRDQIEPLIKEGTDLEAKGELTQAFAAYEKAAQIDVQEKRAQDGMDRVRDTLHDRAKIVYTEAVVAESFSDFETAKLKFREVLTVAPHDDDYFERATMRLKRYTRFREDPQQ